MRLIKAFALVAGLMGIAAFISAKINPDDKTPLPVSIYEFRMAALNGDTIDFSQFKGKTLLIVNTASKCGYTPQYEELEKLHEMYGGKVVVLGFPANNFLWQEPGTNKDIAEFCQKNYGVKFQMFDKISVKGRDKHPLYKWLEAKSGKTPSWNFCKYVVSKNGTDISFFSSAVKPLDPTIISAIEK
ncbi:MAG: glutathione peroxidase [Chryseolinea sp.]